MDVQTVVEFVELTRKLNFTTAARSLSMSQPSLSKHIAALEKSLHLSLFKRSASGLTVTRAGQELLPAAYDLINAEKEFLDKAFKLSRGIPQDKLTVSGPLEGSLLVGLFAYLVGELSPQYGPYFLSSRPFHHKTAAEILDEGLADIVFDYRFEKSTYPSDDPIDTLLVDKVPLVAFVSRNHPLGECDSITLDDLRDESLIRLEGNHISYAWDCIARSCDAAGFVPREKLLYAMAQTDLLSIIANLGNSILVVGENYSDLLKSGTTQFARCITIVDDRAFLPISAQYRIDNYNPLLEDVVAAVERYAIGRGIRIPEMRNS